MLLIAIVVFVIWKKMINFTERVLENLCIMLLPELYFKRQN